ncbi:hypothetical protein MADA3029_830006 [Vibrio nigripulchritudo MADA3029]|uniref:Uncharacterized protein n=2 Tax=Vibrio nigripulchritudo TaxID=28173 RepID=U4K462_9VIBR|nr:MULTISPECIES: hypothetical protein [Vibrio]EGU57057.1 hypothetical protein VINI7043_03223 [Vibrio nigripulchritudo ATCC 27043]KJY75866.1 hypothetical protein TW74_15910 [Vibrio nigripulchritudo]UAB71754.1 hypothetical protein INR79_07640 [Vibrio sp. SCSIO 43132]CCN36608.1 hypothetical protein VIBNIAM115_390003 [Vibrio nigripulchritudo AM115]CCN44832.1 hypothetical protein VIBNIFTn2_930006 [Vibrio nigripulchritudo FTn2]
MEIQNRLARPSTKSNVGSEPTGDSKNWLKEPVKAIVKPALRVNPEEGVTTGFVGSSTDTLAGVMTPESLIWY